MRLSDGEIEAYLGRIGLGAAPSVDLEGLTLLQRAHLRTVAFENLDVVAHIGVPVDARLAFAKIVEHRRGGWCFEANAAFASLLEALGFKVSLLGAAVLTDGPTKVIDHLTLEVLVDEPYLVDVGFGDSFTKPLRLNRGDPQDGGSGTYQFFNSPQGTTLTVEQDSVPAAQFRFKRVAHALGDFEGASHALQSDRSLHWSTKPFATRLLDGEDRVTLLRNRLKLRRDGHETETPVEPADWPGLLAEWFDMTPAPEVLEAIELAQNAGEAGPEGPAST